MKIRENARRGISLVKRIEPVRSKQGVYLSLIDDELFRKFFAEEANRKYMCKLLSYFTPYTYEKLFLNLNLYHHRFHGELSDKFREGDFVGLMERTFFSVEMNNSNKLLRNVEYSDRLYSAFANKYVEKDEYCEVYQLNIDNFQFLDETDKPVEDTKETYSVQNDYKELYIRKFYINISLVNVIEKYYTCGKDGLEEWEKTMIVMFDTDKKRVINIAEGNEEYMEYLEAVREFVKGYDLYESYDHRADERQAFIDAAAERGHMHGMEEGLALGHTRGSQEAKQEIAKSLLEEGMSNEKIQKITGLTASELDIIAVS